MVIDFDFYDRDTHKYDREVVKVPDALDVKSAARAHVALNDPRKVVTAARPRPDKTLNIPLGKWRIHSYSDLLVLSDLCCFAPKTHTLYRLTDEYHPQPVNIFVEFCGAPTVNSQKEWLALPKFNRWRNGK